jgi:hypothetical protein
MKRRMDIVKNNKARGVRRYLQKGTDTYHTFPLYVPAKRGEKEREGDGGEDGVKIKRSLSK